MDPKPNEEFQYPGEVRSEDRVHGEVYLGFGVSAKDRDRRRAGTLSGFHGLLEYATINPGFCEPFAGVRKPVGLGDETMEGL